jgi:ribulose-5-phosphate 4-epimerase/fuculose-1-phosphate aldolase
VSIDHKLHELYQISAHVGNRIDFVQGGGGNTSVKLNDALMAVKASGFELKDLTPDQGFTVVKHKEIVSFFDRVNPAELTDPEKTSADFISTQVTPLPHIPEMKRPSMETGFHAILNDYVIHTHSVYSNIINCAQNGEELMQDIFKDTGLQPVWIPYVNPGFSLSWHIKNAKAKAIKEDREIEVVFLQNHGLIVTAANAEACMRLHDLVNDQIQKHFNISTAYPAVRLDQVSENTFLSTNPFLTAFFGENQLTSEFFDNVLFPDQVIYFNGNFSFSESASYKINIDGKNRKITYNTNKKEARIIEETLIAYLWILKQLNQLGLPAVFINYDNVSYINNMESEKYRKSLL